MPILKNHSGSCSISLNSITLSQTLLISAEISTEVVTENVDDRGEIESNAKKAGNKIRIGKPPCKYETRFVAIFLPRIAPKKTIGIARGRAIATQIRPSRENSITDPLRIPNAINATQLDSLRPRIPFALNK